MSSPRVIAFYLPQFHPIPENDEFWGKGFTEWTNVTRATPMYPGHHQPQLPGELGFYDLRMDQVQREQAALSKAYGIHGFCFHYYWFNGHRVLETPLENLMRNPDIDQPFCLNFANENWTRRWDGLDDHVLLEQKYSPEDDVAFAEGLVRFFKDPRYIRVGDKPVFMVYRTELFPDIEATTARWRTTLAKHGITPYLVRVEAFDRTTVPATIGFDAACDFPPHHPIPQLSREELGEPLVPEYRGRLYDYRTLMREMLARKLPNYRLFRTVAPAWDNTARRMTEGSIFVGSSPDLYSHWLSEVLRQTVVNNPPNEQLVFVNAWNEWAEGAYLEPCKKLGRARLEATLQAIARTYDTSTVVELVQKGKWDEETQQRVVRHLQAQERSLKALRDLGENEAKKLRREIDKVRNDAKHEVERAHAQHANDQQVTQHEMSVRDELLRRLTAERDQLLETLRRYDRKSVRALLKVVSGIEARPRVKKVAMPAFRVAFNTLKAVNNARKKLVTKDAPIQRTTKSVVLRVRQFVWSVPSSSESRPE